jgi:hypothetical protein
MPVSDRHSTTGGAIVDHLAAVVGLPIDPAYRAAVAENFERLMAMAALVMEYPLPDDAAPAPVYRP